MDGPVDYLKKNCLFIVHCEQPVKTTIEILEYFYERKIIIESLLLMNGETDLARLQISCSLAKDRIRQFEFHLSKMMNVIKIEVLSSNKRIQS